MTLLAWFDFSYTSNKWQLCTVVKCFLGFPHVLFFIYLEIGNNLIGYLTLEVHVQYFGHRLMTCLFWLVQKSIEIFSLVRQI